MATQYLSKTGLEYLWGRITTLFQPKEAGKGLSTNDLTNAMVTDIAKISNLETQVTNLVNEGGEPNVLESVKVNGTALTITGKAVDVTVPTAVSELTNDSGFLVANDIAGKANSADVYAKTETYTKTEVDSAIADAVGDITSFEYESVASLPASGEKGVVYLVPNSGNAPNVKDEYIWVNNAFEKIGTTEVDLSGYLQTTDIEAITTAEIDEITGAATP